MTGFVLGLALRSPAGRAARSASCSKRLIFRHLYERDHLDQVLATFGVILFLNEACRSSGARRR